MKLIRLSVFLVVFAALFSSALPVSADATIVGRNSGFYDHQVIEYQQSAVATAASPQAAIQISKGLVVYHIVDSTGATPAVQCARLFATFPNDNTSCNVLNSIPTEVGYTGDSWNLQIFHWKAGKPVTELSKDDDILAAVADGRGTLVVTNLLVRCPVVDFAPLR